MPEYAHCGPKEISEDSAAGSRVPDAPAASSGQPAIHVDADACPAAVRIILEQVARQKQLPLIFYIDDNHELYPSYGAVRQVGQGHDAVDLALVNQVSAGDLVVTQDYGLAALVLSRQARAMHPDGRIFDNMNIDRLLLERHLSAKARKAGQRTSHPRKRKNADNLSFKLQLLRQLSADSRL